MMIYSAWHEDGSCQGQLILIRGHGGDINPTNVTFRTEGGHLIPAHSTRPLEVVDGVEEMQYSGCQVAMQHEQPDTPDLAAEVRYNVLVEFSHCPRVMCAPPHLVHHATSLILFGTDYSKGVFGRLPIEIFVLARVGRVCACHFCELNFIFHHDLDWRLYHTMATKMIAIV
jgi:hypothetical protein